MEEEGARAKQGKTEPSGMCVGGERKRKGKTDYKGGEREREREREREEREREREREKYLLL